LNFLKPYLTQYILHHPESVFSWTGLLDQPLSPEPFRYEQTIPPQIPVNLKNNYINGIRLLNEYITFHLTDYFFSHVQVVTLFNVKSNTNASLKITHRTMNQIYQASKGNTAELDSAIMKNYFGHNSDNFNKLIARTDLLGCSDINELAVYIGSRTKINAGNHSTRLLNEPFIDSGRTVNHDHVLKRVLKSVLTIGRHPYPGVVEIPVAAYVAFGISQIKTPLAFYIPVITGMGLWYITIHEAIHDYSMSPDYLGLIPITITPNIEFSGT
jgi:hypothetical protein